MRFTVVTYGSEGDSRPLAALCRGLIDAGHEIKLFAEESTLSLARTLGVPCEGLAGDVQSILPIVDPMQKLRMVDVLKLSRDMKALIAANTTSWIRCVTEHARGSDALLFSSLALGIGITVGHELRKPVVSLWFQPVTPTRAFASPLMRPMPLPGWLNLMTYRLLHRQMWAPFAKPTQVARMELFGSTTHGRPRFDFPILYGISRHLVTRPDDWPDTHRICGHWSLPADHFKPSDGLRAFLDAGEPPIYAGFGSVSSLIRRRALRALIDAVAGRRAIFMPGWSKIDSATLPSNFHIARDIPHEWLFPRMSVVIHHGGAGTTHTAARAGVPQIVLPIGADQPFWASRVAAEGVAPYYSNGARLKADALARMIDWAEQSTVRSRARSLGEAMSEENGIGDTIRKIEKLIAKRY